MSHVDRTAAAITMVAVLGGGCSGSATMVEGERAEDRATSLSEQDEPSPGESDRDGDGRSVEDAEESGAELTLNEAYEDIRNGVRLTLTYDAGDNAFSGAVENTTTETLRQVRVEVHLSNGQELGPTPAADLGPGERREVALTATNRDFDRWTAHPEVEGDEHADSEEDGEHE